MPQPCALPPEWACLEGRVSHVQRVSDKEVSCSCPSCGETGHVGTDAVDRCRLFTDSHPALFCRKCGLIAYPDQFGGKDFPRPSSEQLETWRGERVKAEEARKRSAERALENLRRDKVWEQYHNALGDSSRKWWRSRGIPDKWQDYWGFGWKDEYYVKGSDGETYYTPCATIPLFTKKDEIANIKHRLVTPPDGVGKYRYELKHQPAPLFLTRPDRELADPVIAIEGELKAAVTFIYMKDLDACVVGLPGTNPPPRLIEQLQGHDVTLILDPGSDGQATKLAKAIGRCRVLTMSAKVDDVILAMHADPYAIRSWLRQARGVM